MAGEAQTIQFRVEVPGATEGAAAFGTLANRFEQVDRAAAKNTITFKQASESLRMTSVAANDNARNMDRLAASAQRVMPVFSALGGTIGRLSPELGGFASALTRAGGAIGGMTSLIGGVGGLAAGTLIWGLGLLVESLRNTKTAEEELAASVERTNAAFEAQYNSAAKITERLREADERRRLGDRRRQLMWPGFASSVTQVDPYAAAEAQKRLDRQRFDEVLGQYGEGAIVEGGEGGARPNTEFETMQRRIALEEQRRRLGAMSQDYADREAARNTRPGQSFSEAHQQFGEENANRFQATLDAAREADKELAKIDEAQQARYEKLRETGMDAFRSIGTVGVSALQSIAKGQKVTMKQVIGSIGDELVAKGVVWGFEGAAKLASSYGTDPAGWELVGLGAAATAAGIAMGAVGASGSNSSGSGARERPAEPTMSDRRVAGAGHTTINVNQQNLVGDARSGVEAVRAIREAERQGLVSTRAA